MSRNNNRNFLDQVISSSFIKLVLDNHISYLTSKGLNFNWGIIWNMLNPLIIVIGFAILFSTGIRGQGRDLEYFLFLILFWFGFSQIVNKCINFKPKPFLIYKKNLNFWILITSETVSQVIPLFIRFLLCAFTMTFLGFELQLYHLTYCFILISLFAFFYGCIMRAMINENSFLSDAHGFVLTGLFFLSSILISVPLLPENIRDILLYNPLVHLFEWTKYPTTGIFYEFIDLNYFLNFLFWMVILAPILLKIYLNKLDET